MVPVLTLTQRSPRSSGKTPQPLPYPDTMQCTQEQAGYCVVWPKNKSCSLVWDKTCNPECPKGTRAAIVECQAMCVKVAKVKHGRYECDQTFDYFFCGQKTIGTISNTTGCEFSNDRRGRSLPNPQQWQHR